MTAIKPAETRRVVAVAAETYPVNAQCAWPDSDGDAVDAHHCFPRSTIGGDSYFVSMTFDTLEEAQAVVGKGVKITPVPFSRTPKKDDDGKAFITDPIPHVVGLSREIHEQVEKRQKKILLVGGIWIGFEKDAGGEWVEVGPLSPQPGSTAKKTRKRFKGEKRRKRRTISIRVPNDEQEDGAGLLDEKMAELRELLGQDDSYPPYYVISAALDYTLLNADSTDFETAE
jgi:hypothetical protein